MKKLSLLILSASFVWLAGCSQPDNSRSTANIGTNVPAVTPNNAAKPASAVALNPPHGAPDHRCDIEVGAPLNTNGIAQPNLTAPVLKTPPVQGAVAAGTNPPHGQPGHDCSIPVGAPLNK